jgi:NAD(P)H-quinone oxidoreductase subunit 5
MANDAVSPLPTPEANHRGGISSLLSATPWLLCLVASLVLVRLIILDKPAWAGPFLQVDGLAALMWLAIGFFGGIVYAFSRRYMAGSLHLRAFLTRLLGFMASAAVFVAANHFILLAAAWLAMGLIMAGLIGHVPSWPQARAAKQSVRRRLLLNASLLTAGLLVLGWHTGQWTITGAFSHVGSTDPSAESALVALLLIAAAGIQCALVPMHTWLLCSMTAPTPASALMHAGFVNGGGILVTRFAPLFGAMQWTLTLLLVLGAVSAILGKVLKSLQPEVKKQLACSTIGQMGFMLMQAGLGFFSAAITHLILHGCYKAYLFLGVGERLHHQPARSQAEPRLASRAVSLMIGLLLGAAGAWLFLLLTGKGAAWNTGLLLGLFVALTVVHATRDVLANLALPPSVRILGVPLIFFPLIVLYSLIFNSVNAVIGGLPGVDRPFAMSPLHYAVGGLFVVAYVVIELGWHQRLSWLYVKLINLSQPVSETVTLRKRDYHAY